MLRMLIVCAMVLGAPGLARAEERVFQVNAGKDFVLNSKLTSANGTYEATFQADGNLVLYKVVMGAPTYDGQANVTRKAIWATKTMNKGATYSFGKDGNLVVFDKAKKSVWASNTASKGAVLIMQDDGNLVIYTKDRKPVWASGTNGK